MFDFVDFCSLFTSSSGLGVFTFYSKQTHVSRQEGDDASISAIIILSKYQSS